MKLIAITTDYYWTSGLDAEAKAIVTLLGTYGYWRVHIRKPKSTIQQMADLIDRIPLHYRNRVSIHDHFQLASEYGLGGIHLNGRNPGVPEGWYGIISISCHSIKELEVMYSTSCPYNYAFLSPIFDSFSKSGYKTAFVLDDLKGRLPRNVIALGGVTTDRLSVLKEIGFEGAAMLTKAWPELDNNV